AYSTYRKRVFVATDCVKVADSKPEDNGEELEVVLMSIPEFREHLRSGRLTDVEMGYLALDFLGLL
ncbi:MAG: NUDIX hydrolase, partial [Candidatus Moranbacteria bacterium]|nr:NUDIX hydrolase [Candidatus Moranbacteria bacterium]